MRLHGAEKVNAAGVAALQYPAILASVEYEFRAVRDRLSGSPQTSPQKKET